MDEELEKISLDEAESGVNEENVRRKKSQHI